MTPLDLHVLLLLKLIFLCCVCAVQLKPDTIIHVWKGNQQQYKSEMANVTSVGYQTLLSTPWYLNRISYGQDWQGHYKADPQDFDGLCLHDCFWLSFFFLPPSHCKQPFSVHATFFLLQYLYLLCLHFLLGFAVCVADFIVCFSTLDTDQCQNVTAVQICVSLLNK